MRVTNDSSTGCISLDQTQHVLINLDYTPAPTPFPEKTVLCAATDDEVHEARSYPYLQVIGSVMYAMLGTRSTRHRVHCHYPFSLCLTTRSTACPGTQASTAVPQRLR